MQVLEVTKDDHLPKLLCNACVNALDNTYANAKKIQKFQQALENKFNNKLTTSAFQASSSSQIEKKPARPTHLNLTLQDLFNHNDTTTEVINESTKNGNNAELLSTPEGPHHEELKDYIATFPNENQAPALISPRNAELLIPSSTCKIGVNSEATNLVSSKDTNIPTIHWAENEMFPTAVTSTVSKPSTVW